VFARYSLKMATNIADLLSDDEMDNDIELPVLEDIIDKDDMGNVILEFSYPEGFRITALELYNDKFEQDIAEIVNKITGMYIFSRTKVLEEYLYALCMNSALPPSIKVLIAKGLCSHGEEIGYEALNNVCNDLADVPTPVQIDTIKNLFDSFVYRDNALYCFIRVIDNKDIPCDFRYKTILSLENDNDDLESLISSPEDSDDEEQNTKTTLQNNLKIEKNKFLPLAIKKSMLTFFHTTTNDIMYRLLAGQYLLLHHCKEPTEKKNIEIVIIDIAEDPNVEYNLRADAADIILQFGSDKQRGKKVIHDLGNIEGKARTLFENAQNAHYDEFAHSVNEGIDFLNTIPLLKIDKTVISFEYVKKQVDDLIKEKYSENPSDDDKAVIDDIHIALNRINMDRALYSKYNCALIGILLKVWTYIDSHENGTEMKQRLLEELFDMAGICSTGFAERLINVISGFGDFNFRISFEEQIVANFSGRLTARAKNIINEWSSPRRLKLVANILINMDNDVRKDVLITYLANNNLLQKYEYIVRGPYRKKINTFEDNDEYKKVVARISNDENIPNNDQKYETYCRMIQDVNGVENTDKYILSEFQGNVLIELSIDTQETNERLCFLTFLREEMLSIREELYDEFKEHISDQDFDNFFRTAVSKFECH